MIGRNRLECFQVLVQSSNDVSRSVLRPLVVHNRPEMLRLVLFECGKKIARLSIEFLEDLIKQSTSDEIMDLLKKKIEEIKERKKEGKMTEEQNKNTATENKEETSDVEKQDDTENHQNEK